MVKATTIEWLDGIDGEPDARVTLSVCPYSNGEIGIVLTVYDLGFELGKTWVLGGPLHGEEEAGRDAKLQHGKWVFRVAHAPPVHPAFSRSRRRKP